MSEEGCERLSEYRDKAESYAAWWCRKFPGIEADDAKQEALIVLSDFATRFKPKRRPNGVKIGFWTACRICIHRRLCACRIKAVRSATGRLIGGRTAGITRIDVEDWGEVPDPYRDETPELDAMLECFRNLSHEDQKLLGEYYGIGCDPMSVRSIAKRYGERCPKIETNLRAARQRLRECLQQSIR